MRRTINNKLKQYLIGFNGELTINELLPKVNKKFKENYTRLQLQKYLVRNKIPYRYTNINKSHNMGLNIPIGTEYTKPDGMILVKVSRNKWVYKQRLIYEKYYGVRLKDDEYVIFLDGNRNNFNIDNLKLLTRQEASYLGVFKVNGIDIKDRNVIETEIAIAKAIIKTKELNDRL